MDDLLLPLPIWRAFAFAFGLLWGSFLNVVIYRLPRDLSVVKPGSHCPACKQPIPFYRNIPVISYVLQRGRAAWVEAAPDDEVNVGIRDSDNERALAGPDAVLTQAREHVDALPGLLAAPREPDTIFIPWQGWSLTTTDFLTTRMMEMVVHGDDLASSVGLPTPTYHHHRLVTDGQGRKLSKSDRDTSLRALREAGVSVADVREMVGL